MIHPYFEWLSNDGKLILIAKIIRTFAYGFLSVILAIYLKLIGFEDLFIGIIISTTLINSVIFTMIASFLCRQDRQKENFDHLWNPNVYCGSNIYDYFKSYCISCSGMIGTINVTVRR